MAIAVTNKTSGGQFTAATSISTASISPSANTILVVGVAGRRTSGPTQPTVSGLSLTWNHVAGQTWATSRRLDVFWALVGSSPGSGSLTFQWASSHDAVWIVDQITEADSDGPVQSAVNTATGTTVAAALGTLRDAQSVAWAAFCSTSSSWTWSPEGGASESAEAFGDNVFLRIAGHYKTNDATVTGTVSTSSDVVTVAIELGIAAYVKTGKAAAPFKGSGARGSGGIVMTKAGAGRAAFKAAGYKMPVQKTGAARSAFRAAGSYRERDVGITSYLEARILNWLFGGVALAAPSSLWLALFTTAPDTGTPVEPSGNGYARAGYANVAAAFGPAAAGATSNHGTVAFPKASGSWGSIVGIGVYDASSGGNLWLWRPASLGTVASGETVVVAAGGLAVTLD